MKRTTKKAKAAATAPQSEIIEQCVIFLQCKAAFKAGFDADVGDFIFAGCGKGQGGRQYKNADGALRKLIELSRTVAGNPPLTADELRAEAVVLRGVVAGLADRELTKDEKLYVRFFASEVEDYLEHGAGG